MKTISIFNFRFFYLLLLRFSQSFIESAALRPERQEETKSIQKKWWYCNNKRWRDWLAGKI